MPKNLITKSAPPGDSNPSPQELMRERLRLAWEGIRIGLFSLISAIVIVAVVLLALHWVVERGGWATDFKASNEALSQIVSIVVGAVTLVVSGWLQIRHEERAEERLADRELEYAKREVYQRLELESIPIFRFEAEHVDLIRPFWEEGVPAPKKGKAEWEVYRNYVCQILNLHEMAVRFEVDGVVPDGVFNSWIAWMWDVSKAPGFSLVWQDVSENYVEELQFCYVTANATIGTLRQADPEVNLDEKLDVFKAVLLEKALQKKLFTHWTAEQKRKLA